MTESASSSPPVYLPQDVAAEIIAHAREGKPEEVCGVVRGRDLRAFEAVRGQNVADDKINNYEVDPQTLLRQFDFEDAGDEMMGIYHSHPVSEAYPSATDAWNAHYPDSVYFICSLENDAKPIIRAYRMTTLFLETDAGRLIEDLAFYETRPGLFAYYQPTGEPIPPTLSAIIDDIAPPFYIVYFAPSDPGWEAEFRAVTIREHPIVQE